MAKVQVLPDHVETPVRRYVVLCSLTHGDIAQMQESDDLEAAKRATEELARRHEGYFFVFDRMSKSIVYVYSLRAAGA